MASNLETSLELAKVIEQQNKLYEQQSSMMKTQLGIMERMVQVMNEFRPNDKKQDMEDLNQVLDEMSQSVENFGSKSTISATEYNKLAEEMLGKTNRVSLGLKGFSKVGLLLTPIVAVVEKLGGGFKFLFNIFKSGFNIAKVAIGSITDLAISIITFPFKMLKGLINLADQGGDTGLRQALEDIRKEFGDLRKNGSEAIIDIARGMRGQLAETGLRSIRIFGNLAERLKTIAEYATNMGAAFDLVRQSFLEQGERVGAYIKGLGLTQEGQRALAESSVRSGNSLQELGRQITTFAYGVGEAFGFNGKLVSRDVGNMMNDFKNFGNLGVDVLANVSVYARKLGVEFTKLLGVVDKFDNFQGAAEGAAHLSQAFGLQLDTLSLITEQDPAARIEQLRKAFFAAGKSVENMTRQERALLAQQTGLDDNTLSLVFAQKNAATSYSEIQKQSDATKKKQLSQAEAMEKLSHSIERMVKSGNFGSGGFFDRFLQGFSLGIRRSIEFRKVIMNLRQSLRVVWRAGIETGHAFVKAFPGVKEVFGALQEMFDPRKMKRKMTEVVGAFKTFFKGITENPKQALNGLLTSLHNTFFKNFDIRSSGGGLVKAFTKFWKTVFQLGIAAVEIGIEALVKTFKDLFTKSNERRFKEILKSVNKEFGILWKKSSEFVKTFIKDKFLPGVSKGFDYVVDFLKNIDFAFYLGLAFDHMTTQAKEKFAFLVEIISTTVNSINWKKIFTGIAEVLSNVFNNIVSSGVIQKGFQLLMSGISQLWDNMPDLFEKGLDILYDFAQGVQKGLALFFKSIGPKLRQGLRELVPILIKGAFQMKDSFDNLVKRIPEILWNVITVKIPELIKSGIPHTIEAMKAVGLAMLGVFEGFIDYIRESNPKLFKAITIGLTKAKEFIVGWASNVENVFKGIREFVKNSFQNILNTVNGVFTGLKTAINSILSFVATVMTKAAGFMQRVNPALAENLRSTAKGITNFSATISSSIDGLNNKIVGQVDNVKNNIDRSLSTAQAGTRAIARDMVTTVSAAQISINRGLTKGVSDTRKSVEQQVQDSVNATIELAKQAQATTDIARNARNGRGASNGSSTESEAMDGLERARSSIGTLGPNGRFSKGQSAELRRSLANVQHMLSGPSTNGEISYSAFMSEIQDRGLARLEAGATAMVDSIKSVHTTIKDLKGIDLNADLRVLNDKLGLGARKKLSIDQGNLQLNVTVNVKLDVEELEETLSTRPGGSRFVISDRNPWRGT